MPTLQKNEKPSKHRKSNTEIFKKSAAHKNSNGSIEFASVNNSAQRSKHFQMKLKTEKLRQEREILVLWRTPIRTLKYCVLELKALIQSSSQNVLRHRFLLAGFLILSFFLYISYHIRGRHQIIIDTIRQNTWFVIYWLGLGILSSVGLGTGLHTFLLYLGPHIASVTLAAYECNSLNFPVPPYPDEILCPDESAQKNISPNLWNIMSKVRIEAFLWGAGTALGELPPYFMAKAARLSGYDPEDNEDLSEFQNLKKKRKDKNLRFVDKGKIFMEKLVQRVGFFGILACASIPNPLFDLAGITCGHFLVPFWTFFGATLIGKAIIKMHIQKMFVIIAFNESLIKRLVDMLQEVPVVGNKLQDPLKAFLENQKIRLHRQETGNISESGNLLSKLFEAFVMCMIVYFVISIVNSLAQSYHKRIKNSKNAKKSMGKI